MQTLHLTCPTYTFYTFVALRHFYLSLVLFINEVMHCASWFTAAVEARE